ncbi:MAG: murein biosynthesis integral membrane protein MurJ [Terrimicrobiaceae bacterium]|nr:murein biosynthesis integral membrane protein MurJ [Terrimicrobiaceae bacterium]
MSHRLNTRASGVIAAAVMLSRVLGLVREMLLAGLFGSALMGIFTVAFRAPNLLRDLFAEGALSTAFVTVFSKKIEAEGREAAWRLASKMMTLTAVFMSLVSLLGVAFAPQLAGVLAMGFAPEDAARVVLLTRIMFPFILLVSLAALAMGMLNASGVFGVPALASSFFNIGSILCGALAGWWLDPSFGPRALVGLALGTLLGGFLQFAVQLPALRRAGFGFRPDFRWADPGVSKILGLMVPSVIAASAVQINVLVNTSFASFLGTEAVSWLNFAFRLMQLPLGVFGVAVATITLPVVSRIAASANPSEFGPTLGRALRLAVFLTLPASVGLWMLAAPIIGLIYERGEFTAHDTMQTGLALQCYALGLTAYACVKVLSPAFYALDRRWTPMLVSFAAIGLNLALNYAFIFRLGLGHRGLALATAASALFNFATLGVLMRWHAGRLGGAGVLACGLKCAVACVPLALVCQAGLAWGGEWISGGSVLVRAPALLSLIGLAAASYAACCLALGVGEVRDFTRAVLGRFGGARRAGR